MNYDELIKNWHTKASGEDYFSKFVFEYLAFIAFLKKRKFTDSHDDRHAIQQLKRDGTVRDRYFEKFEIAPELQKAWIIVQAELNKIRLGNASGNNREVEEIKWWNCPHDNLNQQTPEERGKVKGVIHNLSDWENMVEFWYSIRNNLFHGSKDPLNERDQLLVENGYKTLRPLVEILLSS